jgi:hypothetical protein
MDEGDKQLYWGDFEADGEETVRTNLALGRYQRQKAALAQEWLTARERLRNSSAEAEQAALAKAQADAASRAATAAERSADIAERALSTAKAANTRATMALVIAAISIIATVVIAYLRPS